MTQDGVPEGPKTKGTERHLPEPPSRRHGVALCLSGGGYRAALFHLGACRRLNELGVLSQVNTIASVSGGSILSAHIATRVPDWPSPGERISDWDALVARPFKALMARNIRTWPVLSRLLPWNWLDRDQGTTALERAYGRHLTRLRLPEVPERPRYVFCSTDVAFGVNWVFDSGRRRSHPRVGDYQAGYMTSFPDWPLARAVAASSCFPPVFNPLRIALPPRALERGAYDRDDRDDLVRTIHLSDGGVYDNLGIEPVWKDHEVLLVSDGGAVFGSTHVGNVFARLWRLMSITGNGGSSVRKRWLIASLATGQLRGAYWGIGGDTTEYPGKPRGYSAALADEILSRVRTDIDAFSESEIAALENHGYFMANAAVTGYAPNLIRHQAQCVEPNPALTDDRVRYDLAESSRRRVLGRWRR